MWGDLFFRSSMHKNVCRFYGLFVSDQKEAFIIMELFRDGCIGAVFRQGYNFAQAEKISICSQLCCGIHHLHREGIIHADIALRYPQWRPIIKLHWDISIFIYQEQIFQKQIFQKRVHVNFASKTTQVIKNLQCALYWYRIHIWHILLLSDEEQFPHITRKWLDMRLETVILTNFTRINPWQILRGTWKIRNMTNLSTIESVVVSMP